jgi:fibronectin-binding autotransporter adhesin
VLTGTNTYTGGTTINKGVLQLGDGGTTGSIIGDVKNYGSLVFNRSDDVSFKGIVSGSGSLRQAGTGTVTLTGANTYTGGTTIAAGTLQLGDGGTTGSIVGDVKNYGSLIFKRSDDLTFNGDISGSGSLEQSSTGGTLTLTGTNTYTGGTTIDNGTLQLGNDNQTGSLIGDVTNNGSLIFNPSDDLGYQGVISGSGTLVKSGKGTLTLTGANTYTGGTTVHGGMLEIASGTPGTGTITVNYNGYHDAILRLDSTASLSNHVVLNNGTLDNAGSLINKVDSAAVDSYTGSATILNHDRGRIEGKNSGLMLPAIYSVIENSSGGAIEGGVLGVGLDSGGEVNNDGIGSVIGSSNGIAVRISGASATVKNTGGGTITGGSTAIYLKNGGEITNGSGSIIKTTDTAGACQETGGCSIFVPTSTDGLTRSLTLTNAGTIVGDVHLDTTAFSFITLWAGSSIQGNLDMGPNSRLTLQGSAGTVEYYSHAVTGKTTFAELSKYGDGTWIIDNNELDSVTGTGIAVGTLQVGNGGTEGSIGQNDIYLNSTLVFDRSDDVVFNGRILGGGGSLVQAGSGTLILTADYLSPSRMTIESGALQLGSGGTIGLISADILNNGSLIFDYSDDTVLFGAVSGTGGLTQDGPGTLTLTASNTYSGGTTINNGALLAMTTVPGDVTVNVAGALDGYALSVPTPGVPRVAGNLSNAGKVSVHASDSIVGGNYAQASTGTLAVSLGSKLDVAGSATLNGGTLEVTGADSGYVSNTHTNVLTAAGGVTGTFDQLVKGAGVVFTATTINYDANSVWLDTTGLDVTTAAAGNGVSYTPASFGSARRVQGAFEQLDARISGGKLASVSSDFVRAAGQFQQAPTLQAAQASLQSLSGQLHAVSAAMTFEAIDASSRALSGRFDNLLDKGIGFGMWTGNLSVGGDMARSGFDGAGFQLNGWLVGSDRQIGHSGVAGFAFGRSQGQQRLNRSVDHDSSRNTEGMLYAGVLNGNWYTQGRVGLGRFQQDVSRQLLLGESAQGVWTHYGGSYDVAYGESGLHFGGGNSHITPFVDVQYARVNRDGFTEQGAGGFGLRSNAQTLDRWQAGLGVRAGHHWNLDGGRAVDFSGRAQWQRTLASHGDVFDASFVGLQQWQPIAGIGLSRYSGLFGLAMDATLSARTALTFNYDYQTGQRNQAQMLSARLNVVF